jgi:O-antigen ligase
VTLPPGASRAGSGVANRRASGIIFGLAVIAIAGAVGVVAASVTSLPVGVALLAAPALVAFGFLVVQGPKWCLLGLIAAVVFGYAHDSVTLGSVDLRVPDLFLIALAGWVVVLRARNGQRGWIPGRPLLALWLAALGLSLYPLLVRGEVDAGALVGWLRLVATFALVWLVPYALYRLRDIEFVLGGIAFITTTEIFLAVVSALAKGHVGVRLSGANGPNVTGLLAAIVVVLALHGPIPVRPPLRLFMFATGVVGLLMSRSLGSTAAAVVALGIYGVRVVSARRTDAPNRDLVVPTRLILMLVVGLGVAMALRPANLPGSSEFGGSSTAGRVVIAAAGLELFKENPVFGVGWQRAPVEVGSPTVVAALQKQFGGSVKPTFIPRQGVNTSEVHNTYVQILAEAGLVGFLLLVAVLITMGRGIAAILRSVRLNQRLYVAARAALVLLVVVLVWWNDNTLYGAQPESVLAATFLGILAAVPAVARVERSEEVVKTAA